MQITLEQYERIQNYLDGKMTAREENDFLAELNSNASLTESFDFEKELRQNLNSIQDKKNLLEKDSDYFEVGRSKEETNSIRSLIDKAGKEWEQENKKSSGLTSLFIENRKLPRKAKIVNIKSWIAVAAAACVILAIGSLVWFMPKSTHPPSIATTNDTSTAKKSANSDITKIATADSIKNSNPEVKKFDGSAAFKKYYAKDMSSQPMPELLAMVPANYQKGNYSYSETINLENVPNTRGSSADINSKQNILQLGHYYKGLSYIEANEDKKAFENLQWIIDSAQSPPLKIKAQWYLVLIYLKQDNTIRAIPLLSSLSRNSNAGKYHKQASEILETLKSQEQK